MFVDMLFARRHGLRTDCRPRQASSPIYNVIEPIAAVPLNDPDALRAALLDDR